MDHYIEIRVLPDLEFNGAQLQGALFAKLHRALGQLASGSVGVSFPDVAKSLGERLRVHGVAADLIALQQFDWLRGLRDYTQVTGLLTVPDDAQYRSVRRVQVKSSAARLRRRSVRKGWSTEEEATARIPYAVEKRSMLPYIQIKSLSNQHMFHLFIEHGPLQSQPVAGRFSSYGLSANATIPWF